MTVRFDEKTKKWETLLKMLQSKYVGKGPIDVAHFENAQLLPFIQKYDYIVLPTTIKGLSPERFSSFVIFSKEEKNRKVGTLIVEYTHDTHRNVHIEELFFI